MELLGVRQPITLFQEEKYQMLELNQRLESYLGRVKLLEEENELLREEIHTLKKNREPPGQRKAQEGALNQTRKMKEEAWRKKDRVEMEVENLIEDIQMVSIQRQKEKTAQAEAQRKLADSRKELEEERRAQIWLREKVGQLERDLMLQMQVHQENMETLQVSLKQTKQVLMAPQTIQTSIPDIGQEYSHRAAQAWKEATSNYQRQVGRLEESLSQAKSNMAKIDQEKRENQHQLQYVAKELESTKMKREMLEKHMVQQRDEHGQDLQHFLAQVNALEVEKETLGQEIDSLIMDRQNLLQVKMSLGLEVATYRALLDSEGMRINRPETNNTNTVLLDALSKPTGTHPASKTTAASSHFSSIVSTSHRSITSSHNLLTNAAPTWTPTRGTPQKTPTRITMTDKKDKAAEDSVNHLRSENDLQDLTATQTVSDGVTTKPEPKSEDAEVQKESESKHSQIIESKTSESVSMSVLSSNQPSCFSQTPERESWSGPFTEPAEVSEESKDEETEVSVEMARISHAPMVAWEENKTVAEDEKEDASEMDVKSEIISESHVIGYGFAESENRFSQGSDNTNILASAMQENGCLFLGEGFAYKEETNEDLMRVDEQDNVGNISEDITELMNSETEAAIDSIIEWDRQKDKDEQNEVKVMSPDFEVEEEEMKVISTDAEEQNEKKDMGTDADAEEQNEMNVMIPDADADAEEQNEMNVMIPDADAEVEEQNEMSVMISDAEEQNEMNVMIPDADAEVEEQNEMNVMIPDADAEVEEQNEMNVMIPDADAEVEEQNEMSVMISDAEEQNEMTVMIPDADAEIEEQNEMNVMISDAEEQNEMNVMIPDAEVEEQNEMNVMISDAEEQNETNVMIPDADAEVEEQNEMSVMSTGAEKEGEIGFDNDIKENNETEYKSESEGENEEIEVIKNNTDESLHTERQTVHSSINLHHEVTSEELVPPTETSYQTSNEDHPLPEEDERKEDDQDDEDDSPNISASCRTDPGECDSYSQENTLADTRPLIRYKSDEETDMNPQASQFGVCETSDSEDERERMDGGRWGPSASKRFNTMEDLSEEPDIDVIGEMIAEEIVQQEEEEMDDDREQMNLQSEHDGFGEHERESVEANDDVRDEEHLINVYEQKENPQLSEEAQIHHIEQPDHEEDETVDSSENQESVILKCINSPSSFPDAPFPETSQEVSSAIFQNSTLIEVQTFQEEVQNISMHTNVDFMDIPPMESEINSQPDSQVPNSDQEECNSSDDESPNSSQNFQNSTFSATASANEQFSNDGVSKTESVTDNVSEEPFNKDFKEKSTEDHKDSSEHETDRMPGVTENIFRDFEKHRKKTMESFSTKEYKKEEVFLSTEKKSEIHSFFSASLKEDLWSAGKMETAATHVPAVTEHFTHDPVHLNQGVTFGEEWGDMGVMPTANGNPKEEMKIQSENGKLKHEKEPTRQSEMIPSDESVDDGDSWSSGDE